MASWNAIALGGTDKKPLAQKLADVVLSLSPLALTPMPGAISDSLPHQSSVKLDRDELVAKLEEALTTFANERNKSGVVEQLSALLLDLDLVDEAGQPVAPTQNVLEGCDFGFLNQVLNAIRKATVPPESVVAPQSAEAQ